MRFFDGQNLTVMDSRHAIVNIKQTSNKQFSRSVCLIAAVDQCRAAVSPWRLALAMAMAMGVRGPGPKVVGSARGGYAHQPNSKIPTVIAIGGGSAGTERYGMRCPN